MFNKNSEIYQALYNDIKQDLHSQAVINLKRNLQTRIMTVVIMAIACILPWYQDSGEYPYVFLFMMCDLDYKHSICKDYSTLYDETNCDSDSYKCDKIKKNQLAGEVYLIVTFVLISLVLLSLFDVYRSYTGKLQRCKLSWLNFIFPVCQGAIL